MKTLLLVLFIPAFAFAQNINMVDPVMGERRTAESMNTSAFIMLQQAHNQMQSTNWERALLTLDAAVALEPASAEALLIRAKVKRGLGMITESRMDYNKALALNPYVAALYGYSGQSGLMEVLASYPQQDLQPLAADEKLKYYYYDINRKLEVELMDTKEAEQLDRVLSYIEQGEALEARLLLDEILETNPYSAVGLDLMGNMLLEEGEFERARNYFNEAIRLIPDFAIAWYNLGRVHAMNDEYQLAREHFTKALELRPDLTKAYFERAAILKSMGLHREAIQDYDEVIEQHGDKYVQAFLNRGLTKEMEGDFSGAFEDLDLIIDQAPDNPFLYKNRGNLHLLFGSIPRGIEDYTYAITLDPDYAEAYFNRGLAHFITYDRVSGCMDLDRSNELGYERAAEFIRYFCAIR